MLQDSPERLHETYTGVVSIGHIQLVPSLFQTSGLCKITRFGEKTTLSLVSDKQTSLSLHIWYELKLWISMT